MTGMNFMQKQMSLSPNTFWLQQLILTSPFNVCNYFMKKRIEYRVKFKYSTTLSWDYNCVNHEYYKSLKRRLKEVELYR